ncbi:MAG: dienelactone hydrolase family protein [Pseudomonadota bacterium]
MKKERLLLLTTIAVSILSGCAGSGESVRTTELHSKKPLDLSAEVFRTATAKAPTVILLHGCAGPVRSQTEAWVKALNGWGHNVVVLDSFRPRGIRDTSVCQRPFSTVSPEQRGAEAHDAARWVLQQPWASSKVGLIGFSHGGNAVLHAVASRDVERNVGTPVATAAVAIYPGCGDLMNTDKPAIPIEFHIGEKDTWTAAGPCRDLARNWSSPIFTYANAVHGYDIPTANGFGEQSNWGVRHEVRYEADATRLTMERVRTFFDQQLR